MSDLEGVQAGPGAGWGLLRGAVRHQRRRLTGGVASGAAWIVAGVVAPLLVARGVDAVGRGSTSSALLWVAAVVAIGLVEVVGTRWRHHFAVRSSAHAGAWLQRRLHAHLLRLDPPVHAEQAPGRFLSRATADVELVRIAVDCAAHTVAYAFSALVVTALLLVIDPLLAALALAPLTLLALAVWRYAPRMRAVAEQVSDARGDAAGVVTTTVTGLRAVRGLRAEEPMIERYAAAAQRVAERALALARLQARLEPLADALPALGLLIVVWLGGRLAIDSRVSVGDLVAFYALVVFLVTPLRVLGQRVGTLQSARAGAGRIEGVLALQARVTETAAPVPPPAPVRGAVEIQDASVRTADDRLVLDGIDLELPAGARVAIVGRKGAGKSVLLSVLARHRDPDGGRVLLDGVDLRDLALADLRRSVALVGERPTVFDDTVRANLALGAPDAADHQVRAALGRAGALEFVDALPEGTATRIGGRGVRLSGGQRARLVLARALLADPAVLLLDDITAALDPVTEQRVVAGLVPALGGRTTVLVTSRPAVVELADLVVVLEAGRVVSVEAPGESGAAMAWLGAR